MIKLFGLIQRSYYNFIDLLLYKLGKIRYFSHWFVKDYVQLQTK